MRCENCGKKHNRKRFCSNKCKDRFHNRTNPRGYGLFIKERNQQDAFDVAIDGMEDGWDGHKSAW